MCIKPVIPKEDKIFHFQNIRLSALFKQIYQIYLLSWVIYLSDQVNLENTFNYFKEHAKPRLSDKVKKRTYL